MSEIPRNNTGLSGEYFVAAELYRRGWSVGMTIGNAKAVDLFAEKESKQIAVQVKSIFKKKNVGFPIMKNLVKPDCYYVFVNLNGDKMISPEYFICTSEEARELIDEYKTRGIITLSKLKNGGFEGIWKKLEL